MATSKLDGAGQVKMATLEDAMARVQSCHGLVEKMAVEVKNSKPLGTYPMALKRMATPLVGQLKSQFSLISDLAAAMILVAGKSAADSVKVRMLREYIGQMKVSLELAVTQVKAKHTIDEEKGEAP